MNISVSNKFRDRALYLLIKRALKARNQYENQLLVPQPKVMKCTVYHDVRVSDVGSSKYDAGKKGINASLSLTFIDIPILEKES